MLIDWVHPSVRDLMINYLMEHDAERRRFLLSTSPAGIVLALSTAGGESGERSMPLLRDVADWNCLEQSVERLLVSQGLDGQLSLMRGLLAPLVGSQDTIGAERIRLEQLVGSVLKSVVDSWNVSGLTLDGRALATLFNLSASAGHHVACPRLNPTWDHFYEAAARAAWEAPDGAQVALDWLNLCAYLQLNEPRFLRSVRWPQNYCGPNCRHRTSVWVFGVSKPG